jgi:hypothetical protein
MLFCIEPRSNAKEATIGVRIARNSTGGENLVGDRPYQFSHHVKPYRDRSITEVLDCRHTRMMDRVPPKRDVILDHEIGNSAAHIASLIGAQVQDRILKRRRILHEPSDQSKTGGS